MVYVMIEKLQVNQFPVGVEFADFRLEDAGSITRFFVGNSTSQNIQVTNNEF